jgi:pyruvate,orthophosphate dikinase
MALVRRITADLDLPVAEIGAKAHGLVRLLRLGLPVPPAVVIGAGTGRLTADGSMPDGLADELATALRQLGRLDGGAGGRVSVRSGAAVSMPGMLDTLLDQPAEVDSVLPAVSRVFASWDSPRARTYRELHGIAPDLGTACIVQTMVHGDRDAHSGAGVALSRDPVSGEAVVGGDLLVQRRGDAVVSGAVPTLPLVELAGREPAVWSELSAAVRRLEVELRDAAEVEFTYESGRLWLLQVRTGRGGPAAIVRTVTELADAGIIDRATAVRRCPPAVRAAARAPRLAPGTEVLARGLPASPGVATGRIALTSESAARAAASGPVVLVRPETSPHDVRGMAAAAGVLTLRGGPASHAAVVARSMGTPAVVGAHRVAIIDDGSVRIGSVTLPAGSLVTIDGSTGEVAAGAAEVVIPEPDAAARRLAAWAATLEA